jgi:hypothetical protein
MVYRATYKPPDRQLKAALEEGGEEEGRMKKGGLLLGTG